MGGMHLELFVCIKYYNSTDDSANRVRYCARRQQEWISSTNVKNSATFLPVVRFLNGKEHIIFPGMVCVSTSY